MQKFFIAIFFALTFFLFFNKSQAISKSSNLVALGGVGKDEIIEALQNQSSCGKLTQACCKIFELQPFQIGEVEIPLVGSVINAITGYLNDRVLILSEYLVKPVKYFVQELRGNKPCAEGNPSSKDLNNCTSLPNRTFNIALLCTNIGRPAEKTACINCSKRGIWTAIGCVDFKMETFFRETLFGFGIGLAGVISLFCIIYSAFMLQTSSGNPERIKKAQEMLTSCIMGLMLIIFSIFILRIIGVDILKIPGLS